MGSANRPAGNVRNLEAVQQEQPAERRPPTWADWREWWYSADGTPRQIQGLPLTPGQYQAAIQAFLTWLLIQQEIHHGGYVVPDDREASETRAEQIMADIMHSTLLRRMLRQGKPPLLERPPVAFGYPAYPDDSDSQGLLKPAGPDANEDGGEAR